MHACTILLRMMSLVAGVKVLLAGALYWCFCLSPGPIVSGEPVKCGIWYE